MNPHSRRQSDLKLIPIGGVHRLSLDEQEVVAVIGQARERTSEAQFGDGTEYVSTLNVKLFKGVQGTLQRLYNSFMSWQFSRIRLHKAVDGLQIDHAFDRCMKMAGDMESIKEVEAAVGDKKNMLSESERHAQEQCKKIVVPPNVHETWREASDAYRAFKNLLTHSTDRLQTMLHETRLDGVVKTEYVESEQLSDQYRKASHTELLDKSMSFS